MTQDLTEPMTPEEEAEMIEWASGGDTSKEEALEEMDEKMCDNCGVAKMYNENNNEFFCPVCDS